MIKLLIEKFPNSPLALVPYAFIENKHLAQSIRLTDVRLSGLS